MLRTLIGGSGRHSPYFFEHFAPGVNFGDKLIVVSVIILIAVNNQ